MTTFGGMHVLPVTTESTDARREFDLGRIAAFHYRFDVARRHMDAAITADPGFALAYIYRGGSASTAEDRARHFERALALRERVTEAEQQMIDAFHAFLMNGDDARAAEIFSELADAYPDDVIPPAHLGLRYFWALDRLEDAVTQFQRAIQRDPGFAPMYAWLGRALANMGRVSEAEAAFQDGVRRFPDDAHLHLALGEFQREHGAAANAVASIERALELDPDFAAARAATEE
jgi:tetratricopeptide (TPR) repeat protein